MEMATEDPRWDVRVATAQDTATISGLLRAAPYQHLHVDWRLPVDWLGSAGFVVAFEPETGKLAGCLAVGSDPPPAAWVRVAAVRSRQDRRPLLQQMFRATAGYLRALDVAEVGWLPRDGWPPSLLEALGFEQINEVETFVKPDLALPPEAAPNPAAVIRNVRDADMERLAEIEAAAFTPLWRHSPDALREGRKYSLSFHVAELGRRIVGFQYSSEGDVNGTAHLVRLTVDPAVQRSGVGSSLMLSALRSYQERRLQRVSLNTQVDNVASHRLYRKFGFEAMDSRMPVWSLVMNGD